jgi:hypothetical protein
MRVRCAAEALEVSLVRVRCAAEALEVSLVRVRCAAEALEVSLVTDHSTSTSSRGVPGHRSQHEHELSRCPWSPITARARALEVHIDDDIDQGEEGEVRSRSSRGVPGHRSQHEHELSRCTSMTTSTRGKRVRCAAEALEVRIFSLRTSQNALHALRALRALRRPQA